MSHEFPTHTLPLKTFRQGQIIKLPADEAEKQAESRPPGWLDLVRAAALKRQEPAGEMWYLFAADWAYVREQSDPNGTNAVARAVKRALLPRLPPDTDLLPAYTARMSRYTTTVLDTALPCDFRECAELRDFVARQVAAAGKEAWKDCPKCIQNGVQVQLTHKLQEMIPPPERTVDPAAIVQAALGSEECDSQACLELRRAADAWLKERGHATVDDCLDCDQAALLVHLTQTLERFLQS